MKTSGPWCALIPLITCASLACAKGSEVYHAQGVMSGEVTSTTVLLQTRLTATAELNSAGDIDGAPGVVRFEWGTDESFESSAHSDWLAARPEQDFIVRTPVSGLRPATRYFYRIRFGADPDSSKAGPTCSFRTLPDPHARAEVRFCMGSCMNYNSFLHPEANRASGPRTATEQDQQLGYPSFAAMAELQPDFFIGTGDIVYYDNRVNPADTLPEMRRCWHEQFRFPRLVEFFARTPGFWSKDDHDFRFNDSDLRGQKLPAPAVGIRTFREQMPILPAGDLENPTYRTHRLNRFVQLWFTEGRDYRSPNQSEDGAEKTLWGSEQKAWLMRTLRDSDAPWKIIISPTPMVGPDDASKTDNHTNLGGFRHEAAEFFQWLAHHDIRNLLIFCGDRHWQFHSIHPAGVEEFGCGALHDENSRRGVAPGSPRGTDPDGKIRQPYTYAEPTGGFLHVISRQDGALRIEFRDDRGELLYAADKKP